MRSISVHSFYAFFFAGIRRRRPIGSDAIKSQVGSREQGENSYGMMGDVDPAIEGTKEGNWCQAAIKERTPSSNVNLNSKLSRSQHAFLLLTLYLSSEIRSVLARLFACVPGITDVYEVAHKFSFTKEESPTSRNKDLI